VGDNWHVELRTGTPTRCLHSAGRCALGTGNQHFNYPEEARAAAEAKLAEYREWTSKSLVPQTPGYTTEYVFDPARPDTFGDFATLVGHGVDLADGTRLVIETGWTLEVVPGEGKYGIWTLIDLGQDSANRVTEVGDSHDEISVWWAVKDNGARLEVPENATPIRIKWRPEVGGY
jgi:hypothetical protein